MFETIMKRHKQRTQLHFRDDGQFQFRKLFIEDGFLVEKEGDAITSAWMLLYKLLKRFDGLKGVGGADMVTISYDRDVILDTFNQVTDAEKPERGGELKKSFVKGIAEAKCYRHEHGKKKRNIADTMVLFLGTAIMGEIIGILILVSRGNS